MTQEIVTRQKKMICLERKTTFIHRRRRNEIITQLIEIRPNKDIK